jgi:hypothetical protein
MSALYSGINLVAHGADDLVRVTETRQSGASATYYAVEQANGDDPDAVLRTLPTVHWDVLLYVGERSMVFYGGDSQRLLVIPYSQLHSVVERSAPAGPFLHSDMFHRNRGTIYTEVELYVLKQDFAVTRAKQRSFSKTSPSSSNRPGDELFAYEPESCMVLCACGPSGVALIAAIREIKERWDEALTRVACDFANDADITHKQGMRMIPAVEYPKSIVLRSASRSRGVPVQHEKGHSLRDAPSSTNGPSPTLQLAARGQQIIATGDVRLQPICSNSDLGRVLIGGARGGVPRVISPPAAALPKEAQKDDPPSQPRAASGIMVTCTKCGQGVPLETRLQHTAMCC